MSAIATSSPPARTKARATEPVVKLFRTGERNIPKMPVDTM